MLKYTKGGEWHSDVFIIHCSVKTQSAVSGLARGLLQPTQVLVFSNGQQQTFREWYRKEIGAFNVILPLIRKLILYSSVLASKCF